MPLDASLTIEATAELFYDTYAKSAGWKNFMGGAMPPWNSLPSMIRDHWMAVAELVQK